MLLTMMLLTRALTGLVPVTNVPEVPTPGDQELRIIVIDPGVSASHQGVGDGVCPELVEVDHPQSVVSLGGDVQLATTRTGV